MKVLLVIQGREMGGGRLSTYTQAEPWNAKYTKDRSPPVVDLCWDRVTTHETRFRRPGPSVPTPLQSLPLRLLSTRKGPVDPQGPPLRPARSRVLVPVPSDRRTTTTDGKSRVSLTGLRVTTTSLVLPLVVDDNLW